MKVYWTTLLVFAGLSALIAIPDAAIVVVLVTAGLGIPLVFAATGLAYWVCLFPLAATWSQGERSRLALAGALGAMTLIAFVALGPGLIGRWHAANAVAESTARDFAPNEVITARTVEIRRPEASDNGTFADRAGCSSECRRLLLSGQVDWVRVATFANHRSSRASSSILYAVSSGRACGAPGVTQADAGQRCVTVAQDTIDQADLVIDFWSDAKPFERQNKGLFDVTGLRSVMATIKGNGTVLRQTEVRIETPMFPSIFAPRFKGMHSSGAGLLMEEAQHNPITLAGVIEKLRLPMASLDAPLIEGERKHFRSPQLDAAITRELISVLEVPSSQKKLTQQQSETVSAWLERARQTKDWTPEQIEFLRRILHDPRMTNGNAFASAFSSNPDVTSALLPDVLEILAQRPDEQLSLASYAARKFPGLDPALLKSHFGKIEKLIKSGGLAAIPMLETIGRLGVDPRPYLLPFSQDLTHKSSGDARVRGACFADRKWAPVLIPSLREELSMVPGKERPNRADRRALIFAALVKLGDSDFVDKTLATGDPKDVRLRRRIAEAKNPNSLCWGF